MTPTPDRRSACLCRRRGWVAQDERTARAAPAHHRRCANSGSSDPRARAPTNARAHCLRPLGRPACAEIGTKRIETIRGVRSRHRQDAPAAGATARSGPIAEIEPSKNSDHHRRRDFHPPSLLIPPPRPPGPPAGRTLFWNSSGETPGQRRYLGVGTNEAMGRDGRAGRFVVVRHAARPRRRAERTPRWTRP